MNVNFSLSMLFHIFFTAMTQSHVAQELKKSLQNTLFWHPNIFLNLLGEEYAVYSKKPMVFHL